MRRKLILLTSVALVVCLTSSALAELVARWQFEGDFTDATGNGHDGTAYGDPAIVDDPIRGQVLEVDGDDRVRVSDAPDLNYGAGKSLTLAVWVNFEPAGAPSGWKTIVVKGRTELGGGTAYVDTLYGFWVSPSNNWHVNAGGFSGDTSPAAGGEWHHLAFVQDGASGQAYFYIDGAVVRSGSAASCDTTGRPLFIGAAGTDQSPFEAFKGRIDDVQIYSHAMLEKDVREIMEFGEDLPQLKAWAPNPADGAEGVTTPLLQWKAGDTAARHDVYFGTNPSPGPAEFILRTQWTTYYYAAGITPGTTYYWRVDEVEADGTTIHTGDVWTFTAVSLTAYRPNPRDGAIYVSTDVLLSWRPGAGAVLHDVYFGTDEAQVTNGTGDTFKTTVATTTFQPEPLAKDTTYYWRIDEFNGSTKTKGQVWSFATMPIISIADPNLVGWWKLDGEAGTTVIDWSGHDHHGVLMGAPQWVPGYDGGALEFDGVDDHVEFPHSPDLAFGTSANYTVTAWVNLTALRGQWAGIVTKGRDTGNWYGIWVSPDNEWVFGHDGDNLLGSIATARDWHHLAVVYANGSKRLYLDGFLDTETTASMNGDNTGGLWIGGAASVTEYLQGKVDDARVYSKVLTEAEIREAMRGDPQLAWDPSPADKSTTDVEKAVPLSWSAGDKAAQHDVYLGTDQAAVKNADTSDTTGIYRGQHAAASYAPPQALQWGRTYCWRIDEVNTDATITHGRVWSFAVADYLIVDDFEDYTDDVGNRIFQTWKDGWGYNEPPPGYAGNGTGSGVGNAQPPFAEQTIVHSGKQSMPLAYDNSGTGGKARYSETQREWATAQDWTRYNVKALTLYVRGVPPDFIQSPLGTFTMSAEGTDIWGGTDEFRYVYKQLSGNGEIIARVDRIAGPGTNEWAKAGVMIRETLVGTSKHAFMAVTPLASHGLAFQYRDGVDADDSDSEHGVDNQTAPYWVKLVRQGNVFTGYHSPDGINWTMKDPSGTEDDAMNPVTIPMAANVYIGLALTSHENDVLRMAQFSNVSTTGSVTGAWTVIDIDSNVIGTNDPEPLYVALEDSAGKVKAVPSDNPLGSADPDWREWNIKLSEFSGAAVNLKAVKKMYIGVGTRGSTMVGGSGKIYVDDIRVYPSRCVPSFGKPANDLSGNCVVDYADLEIMANDWLASGAGLAGDLNADGDVDLADYAVLADTWLDELLWP